MRLFEEIKGRIGPNLNVDPNFSNRYQDIRRRVVGVFTEEMHRVRIESDKDFVDRVFKGQDLDLAVLFHEMGKNPNESPRVDIRRRGVKARDFNFLIPILVGNILSGAAQGATARERRELRRRLNDPTMKPGIELALRLKIDQRIKELTKEGRKK